MRKLLLFSAGALFLNATAFAQSDLPGEFAFSFRQQQDQRNEQSAARDKQRAERNQEFTFHYNYTSEHNSKEIVVGAPYTATATTETTQVLGDGNRIVHQSSVLLARDGQGRTRREETIDGVGPLQGDGLKMIFIDDPVAGTHYTYRSGQTGENEDHVSAQIGKLEKFDKEEMRIAVKRAIEAKNFRVKAESANRAEKQSPEVKHEALGTQVVEGISAEGKRETRTIPAGAIGNERPIEIASESWFSPDLHVVVMSKRSDPRLGETVYKLSDIKRGEPDASLFQPPAGHTAGKDGESNRKR